MNLEKTGMNEEIVLTPEGFFVREANITLRKINFDSAVLRNIASASVRPVYHLLPPEIIKNFDGREISATIGGSQDICWCMVLNSLLIETNYAASADGTWIYPQFVDRALPKFRLKWIVPGNMRLVLAVHCDVYGAILASYLVAFDNAGRAYQLPISNIYKDCKLCTGSFTPKSHTVVDVLQASIDQLNNSNWQGDLYEAHLLKKTQALFAFRGEGKEFIQVWDTAAGVDWTPYATKVATEFITNRVLARNQRGF